MSLSQYAFINADGIVVNAIVGALDQTQQALFLHDYAILFGATQIVAVDSNVAVWIGGSYTDGVFHEPLAAIIATEPFIQQPEGTPDGITIIE